MTRPVVPNSYWPLPFNFTQAPEVQQGQFEHSADWRSTHVNSHRQHYAMPHETYSPYMKLEPPIDGYNYYAEDGPSNDN